MIRSDLEAGLGALLKTPGTTITSIEEEQNRDSRLVPGAEHSSSDPLVTLRSPRDTHSGAHPAWLRSLCWLTG